MSWIFHNAESVADVVNNHEWSLIDPDDIFSCSYYLLESLAVWCQAIPEPDSDAATQDTFDGSNVESGEHGS